MGARDFEEQVIADSVKPIPSKASHSAASHAIALSFGRDRTDKAPRLITLTFEDLVQLFAQPDPKRGTLCLGDYLTAAKPLRDAEKDGQWFMPATFSRPGTRSADDVIALSGFVMDIDTGTISRPDLQALLTGVIYIAHSSYSHSTECPKWRVFMPYATSIGPDQHAKVFEYWQRRAEGNLDARCATTNQLWYTPACPYDAVGLYEVFVGDGAFFDPTSVADLGASPNRGQRAKGKHRESPSRGAELLARIKSALEAVPADDRDVWVRVGLALLHELDEESAYQCWLEWSKKSDKFDLSDAEYTWASFKRAYNGKPVTIATLFHLALQHGWTDALAPMHPKLQAINANHFVAPEGSRIWVHEEHVDPEFGRPALRRLSPDAFEKLHSNDVVPECVNGKFRQIAKGKAWLAAPERRTYQGVCFVPGQQAPHGYYNLYRGFGVRPEAGDWSKLRSHLESVICRGDRAAATYMLNWMAFAVQHPERPAEVAIVLKGQRGTGKGKVAQHFGALFGSHTLQVTNARHLVGNFNAHLRTCIFLFVDEALWAGDKQGENILKALITEPTLIIEKKGQDVVTAPNRLKVMMASNNDWVVPAGAHERRYFVLEVGEQHMQDHEYFAAIDRQMKTGGLAAMLHDLLQLDLSTFNVRAYPRTAALDDQVLRSLDSQTRWWIDHLGETFSPEAWRYQERSALVADFAAFDGRHIGKGSQTRLGTFLRRVVPGGVRKVEYARQGTTPTRCYEFPTQDVCRKAIIETYRLQHDPWD